MATPLRIGMVGYGFMGRTHSNAFSQVPHFFDVEYKPVLKTICARNAEKAAGFAEQWGYENSVTDWRALIDDKSIDLIDIASLNGDSGERVREWDSCQFVGFAQVAGEFNFRPTPVDRLKFWYRHKLHGFDDPHGMPTCVGCGRCTVSCPAGIDDLVAVVKTLQRQREEHDCK